MGGRHRRPLDRQATYGDVFGVGEFRSLWLSQALSYIGDQFAQVALAVLVYNARRDEPVEAVVVRSGQEPVVVNLDIPVVEKPEEVHWVDNIHPAPKT